MSVSFVIMMNSVFKTGSQQCQGVYCHHTQKQWLEQKQTLHTPCCQEQHPDELLKSHFVFFRTGSLGICSQRHRSSTKWDQNGSSAAMNNAQIGNHNKFAVLRTGCLGILFCLCSQGHQDDNWYRYRPVLPRTMPSLEATIILHSSELALWVSYSACVLMDIRMLTGTGTDQCCHEQCPARKSHFRFCRPGSLGTFTMKGIPEEVGMYTGRVNAHPLLPQANTPTASREEHSVSPWNWLSQLPV